MGEFVDIFRIQVIAVITSLIMIYVVLTLLKRRKLREEYSLLLLAGGIIIITFSIWRGLLEKVSHFLGIAYAPSMLFVIALLIGVLIFMHFSVAISAMMDRDKKIAQKVALLELEIKKLRNQLDRDEINE